MKNRKNGQFGDLTPGLFLEEPNRPRCDRANPSSGGVTERTQAQPAAPSEPNRLGAGFLRANPTDTYQAPNEPTCHFGSGQIGADPTDPCKMKGMKGSHRGIGEDESNGDRGIEAYPAGTARDR